MLNTALIIVGIRVKIQPFKPPQLKIDKQGAQLYGYIRIKRMAERWEQGKSQVLAAAIMVVT